MGGKGFLCFLVASIIYLVRGNAWVAFSATACQQGLLYGDITSGLPNDIIMDIHQMGHGQMVTSGLPVMSWAMTSHPGDKVRT